MQRLAIYSSVLMLVVFSLTKNAEASCPPPQDEGSWQIYRGKGEKFTVSFPEQPLAAITYRPVRFMTAGDAASYRGNLYSAYRDGIVYLVYSFPGRSETLRQIAGEFGNRYTRLLKVISVREQVKSGFRGQRYLIKFRDADGVLDFYLTDKRIYILQVVGADENNASVKRFLESFTLDDAGRTDGDRGSTAIEIKPAAKNRPQAADELDPGPVFTAQEVTTKALIVLRQEPQYTDEARQGRVSGAVVLKAVLSRSGKVTKIEVIKSLPRGLTEKAIEVARQIIFIPAIKDGVYVSQTVQVEYYFSVY